MRIRVDGSGLLRLSDYVFGEATQQCENPEDCDATAADDSMQLTPEVRHHGGPPWLLCSSVASHTWVRCAVLWQDMETWKIRDTNNYQVRLQRLADRLVITGDQNGLLMCCHVFGVLHGWSSAYHPERGAAAEQALLHRAGLL